MNSRKPINFKLGDESYDRIIAFENLVICIRQKKSRFEYKKIGFHFGAIVSTTTKASSSLVSI